MTEFFDLAPPQIKHFFDSTASTLSTIPLRLPQLADTYDENDWSDLCSKEFIYNQDDVMHKLISTALRQPKILQYLGLEKHEWLIEVNQKFNMLAVLNLVFREGIKVCCYKGKGGEGDVNEEEEDPEIILNKNDSQQNIEPIDSFLDLDSLNAVKS